MCEQRFDEKVLDIKLEKDIIFSLSLRLPLWADLSFCFGLVIEFAYNKPCAWALCCWFRVLAQGTWKKTNKQTNTEIN